MSLASRVFSTVKSQLPNPLFWGWAAIVMGILFRVAEYGNARALWIDEDCLRSNVVGRPIFDFVTPMVRDQLAPPGFLAVARAWVKVAGGSVWSIRIPPLIFGIAALFAMRSVALRYVDRAAVPVVLWICASSWELVYFATEFKQYSSDLLVTLLLLMMADDLARHELTGKRFAIGLLGGILATWCSIPSVFVLAGIGFSLAMMAALDRNWRRLGWLAAMGLCWACSFAASFVVCQRLLGKSDFMWTWWDFAFLPLPPRSWDDLSRVFWSFANVFIAPCGLESRIHPVPTALLASGLFAIGVTSFILQGKRGALIALLVPILLAMLASALRRYPFHGRLLVYLIPPFVLLMAEGVAELARWCALAVRIMLESTLSLRRRR